jgi:hypothetical protein
VLELAPANWKATRDREDVRRALELNPYRALTLGN